MGSSALRLHQLFRKHLMKQNLSLNLTNVYAKFGKVYILTYLTYVLCVPLIFDKSDKFDKTSFVILIFLTMFTACCLNRINNPLSVNYVLNER